jgi:hypothetical protein
MVCVSILMMNISYSFDSNGNDCCAVLKITNYGPEDLCSIVREGYKIHGNIKYLFVLSFRLF